MASLGSCLTGFKLSKFTACGLNEGVASMLHSAAPEVLMIKINTSFQAAPACVYDGLFGRCSIMVARRRNDERACCRQHMHWKIGPD